VDANALVRRFVNLQDHRLEKSIEVGTLLVFGTAIAAGAIAIALVLIVAWLRRPPRGGARG